MILGRVLPERLSLSAHQAAQPKARGLVAENGSSDRESTEGYGKAKLFRI